MFTPKPYQQKDFHYVKQLIAECPLATVIVASPNDTEACHLPLYWEDDGSEYGELCGHATKTNPIHTITPNNNQWLIIFQDMGHYICPNWYPTKWIDHKAVPTWNYRSVHLQVEPTFTTDPKDLAEMVGKLSDLSEQGQPTPWSLSDAPNDYLSGLYRGIVGFTLKIIDFQAQFKLSQDKSTENKQGIISNLQQLNTDAAIRMATLVQGEEQTANAPKKINDNNDFNPYNKMNFHPLTVTHVIDRIDGNAKTVQFAVPEPLQSKLTWQAGQHITLSLQIDGQAVQRSYTISASPHVHQQASEPLQITVKRVAGGVVSNFINDHVQVGDIIEVAPPNGDFTLTPEGNRQRSHYFFGAGSGITPLWAMINSVLIAEPHSTCYLLYANSNDSSIIYRDELATLQKAYPKQLVVAHVLSSPRWASAFKYWQSGRLDNAKIADFICENPPIAQDCQYYICAPNALLNVVHSALQAIDVPNNRIHFESFGGAIADSEILQEIEGVYADLSVNLYGQTHELNVQENETILEAMLNAGIHNAPYSCQSGVCGSCKATLTHGKAAMKNRSALSDEEIANGEILTCQAVCQTDNVVVEYR